MTTSYDYDAPIDEYGWISTPALLFSGTYVTFGLKYRSNS